VTSPLSDLVPERLWGHFDALRAIPRASGEEQAAREHVEGVALQRGWDCARDAAGNLRLRVPATPGRENAATLVLQAHLDMVCEKDASSDFDFSRSAVDVHVEGDWVLARGTTLGADNGIGVAAALAACEEPSIAHGPVEILLTVDEEATGSGAARLDPALVQGRMLLNLDAEDDTMIVVGCAGGCDTDLEFAARRAGAPKGHAPLRVRVSGLAGGHSGLTIHEGRGNAIRLLARALLRMLARADLYLWSLEGGNKHNAIPREATALVYGPPGFADAARAIAGRAMAELSTELGPLDAGFALDVHDADPQSLAPFDCSSTRRLVRLLVALPTGVQAMSLEEPGAVETSANLASVRTDVSVVTVSMHSRSNRASALRGMLDQIDAVARLSGADTTEAGAYYPWKASAGSPLLAAARRAYAGVWGHEPRVGAVHAGLECSQIAARIPGMDLASFGPLILGAHAPGERVSISSVARFYELLCALLASPA
jgi:dipeptidase D